MRGVSENLPMRASEVHDNVAGRQEQHRLHVVEVVHRLHPQHLSVGGV